MKATVLLSAAFLGASLLRRGRAAARHRLWTALFVAMLALPVLATALPALDVPVPLAWGAPFTTTSQQAAAAPTHPSVPQDATDRLPGSDSRVAATVAADPVEPRVTGGMHSSVLTVPSVARPMTARDLLLGAWLAGAAIALFSLGRSLAGARRLARVADGVPDPAWCDAAAIIGVRLGLRRPAQLVVSDRVGTPMAGGVWRPTIFLPVSAPE